jgi:hypothetical protein
MAKITSPLLSLDASGSVAGAITFSKWKGRNYVRQLVKPSNPSTAKQVSVRSMFGFLAQQWALLTPTQQATWAGKAAATTVSEFNAYMSTNQNRWRSLLAPGKSNPVPSTGTVGTVNAQSVVGAIRLATIAVSLTAVNANWGLQVHRSITNNFTPDFTSLVGVLLKVTTGSENFVDSPLIAGTYYWRLIPFSIDGATGAAFAQLTAAVT